MNFIHSPLTWAFLLVLVPLLIHLINMMRHKKVKWAAMEFLLASYKKHRKWIWLKQLLLLLTRMVAIAAVVAIFAQWIPPDRWAKMFGGEVTHHFIVLDDSFSMTDRTAGETAFARAKQVVDRIVERAAAEETQHKITLLRYSRAATTREGDQQLAADYVNQRVSDGPWRESYAALLRSLDPSQQAIGPAAALELLESLLDEKSDESKVLYLVSDFRQRDWKNPAAIDQRMQNWQQAGVEIHLVDCVASERPNLAVTHLAPVEGTRSAGVPLFVTVSVHNFSTVKAENVEVTLTSYAYEDFSPIRHGDDPAELKPETLDKQTELLKSIAPGETVTRRLQIRFPVAGKHVVAAQLPEDAIEVDNSRHCVVDFPIGEPVLIVDGHPKNRHAYFLSAVFQPQVRGLQGIGRDSVRTGIMPTVVEANQLSRMSDDQLNQYRAVYLLDLPRLDEAAVRNLDAYVRKGGGLAIFLGDNVNPTHYSEQLYDAGKGLLPIPLGQLELLTIGDLEAEDRLPDFEAEDHPVLSIFTTGDSSFRRGVVISTFFTTPHGWAPPIDSAAIILATLRDKASTPLVVEKPHGDGRIMLFNTTLAPLWNNWARGHGGAPSFVVTILQLHSYLAAHLREDPALLVGAPISLNLQPDLYQQDAKLIIPAVAPISRKPVAAKAQVASEDATSEAMMTVAISGNMPGVGSNADTQKQGIYEIWAAKNSGELEVRRYAVNVDTEESDLSRVTAAELAGNLQTPFQYHSLGNIEYELEGQAKSHMSEILLYLLITLLLGEQLLAYFTSYHPATRAAA